jgi:hypothetical protein
LVLHLPIFANVGIELGNGSKKWSASAAGGGAGIDARLGETLEADALRSEL